MYGEILRICGLTNMAAVSCLHIPPSRYCWTEVSTDLSKDMRANGANAKLDGGQANVCFSEQRPKILTCEDQTHTDATLCGGGLAFPNSHTATPGIHVKVHCFS